MLIETRRARYWEQVTTVGGRVYDSGFTEGGDGMDIRFDRALFRPSEVADYLWVRRSTLRDWLGTVTRFDGDPSLPTIPFAGLAEARVVKDLREAGLRMSAIRGANVRLQQTLGVRHPLIWRELAHDRRDILRPFEDSWTRARDEQAGIPDVIEHGLHRVASWGTDGYPNQIRIEQYGCEVIIDPRISGGHPIIDRTGIRVEDVLNLVRAGDSLDVAAAEFGLTEGEVQSLILADYRRPRAA